MPSSSLRSGVVSGDDASSSSSSFSSLSHLASWLSISSSLTTLDYVPSLADVLRVLGPGLSLGMQVSTLVTAYQIYKSRSVGQLSSLPFLTLFVNSYAWTLYGYFKQDTAIYIPNGTGALVGLLSQIAFHAYSKEKPHSWYVMSAALVFMITVFALLGSESALGMSGCVLSILVTASPLAVIRTVIQEKSTAALPFATSLIMFVSSASWSTYGWLIVDDPLIYFPNLLSTALTVFQLALFVVYGRSSKAKL